MLGGAVVAALFVRRKVDAEGTQILADTAISLVEPLTRRIEDLEDRVCVLEEWGEHWFSVAQHGRAAHIEQHRTDPDWFVDFEGGK